MSDSTFDSVRLAEGIRMVLKGFGLILTEMGEYTARATARVSNTAASTESAPAGTSSTANVPSTADISSTVSAPSTADIPSTANGPSTAAEPEPLVTTTDASVMASAATPAAAPIAPIAAPAPEKEAVNKTAGNQTDTADKTPAPTVDDITKLIVQKLKKNGSLNEEIQKVVKSFGVATVKDIPEERRADFVEQLKKL